MFARITEVKTLPDLHLWLKFSDGAAGEVDLKKYIRFSGVFAPLREPEQFAKVDIDQSWGNIFWPNGVDLDTEVLYSLVTGKPIVLNNE